MRYPLIIVIAATLFTACRQNATTHVETQRREASGSSGITISEDEAKDHIGENVTVNGTVAGFFTSKQTTNVYLYFDSDIFHPKFAVVWPGSNDPPESALEELIRHAETISVSGRVITEKNVPEIVVTSWAQIN